MTKSNQCMKWIILGGLVVLTGINVYNYCTKNIAKEYEVLQSGGIENYNKLHEAYESTKYKENSEQELKKVKTQVEGLGAQLEAMKQAEEAKVKAGAPAIERLEKIKASHKFINGSKDARFTILEYSELLCPFCKEHSNKGTLEKVKEIFKGEVNVIHVPYLVHDEAKDLELGVLCARDQKDSDTYYAFLKNMFKADTGFKKGEENTRIMLEEAKKSGYDVDALKKCIEEEKYIDELNTDTTEARMGFGVTGTPGNIIIDSKNGEITEVPGMQPVSSFEAAITALKNK